MDREPIKSSNGITIKRVWHLGSAVLRIHFLFSLLSTSHPAAAADVPSTILPTDVIRLPNVQERRARGENFQIRALQLMPEKFYLNMSVESSFRYETNPFQYPSRSQFLANALRGQSLASINEAQQQQIFRGLSNVDNGQSVFRVLPNITAGWAQTPHTRFYSNYFMIRDSLFHSVQLNTVVQSIGGGVQHDFPITRQLNLQADLQFRQLYQTKMPSVFDFLPNLSATYSLNPRTVLYTSVILQMRGRTFFEAPTRELDPFYNVGFLYQRGKWSFATNATLVTNFRKPFNGNALIPINSYPYILDFEIARRLFNTPGLQAFVRAEPIFNTRSHDTPGLSGFDFRLFYGLRLMMGKPPLTASVQQIRAQIKDQVEARRKREQALPPVPEETQNTSPTSGPGASQIPTPAQEQNQILREGENGAENQSLK